MSMTRAEFITKLCDHARMPSLAEALIASDMDNQQIRTLLHTIMVLKDGDDLDLGVVPVLPASIAAVTPDLVQRQVQALLSEAVADAIEHKLPKGPIQ